MYKSLSLGCPTHTANKAKPYELISRKGDGMKIKEGGFTLIEVMIAAALSTIIIFGVFGILQVSNRSLQIIHAKMSLQEGPREALFKMAQEIRQTGWHQINDLGTDVNNIESSSTITFNVPIPDPATLVAGDYGPNYAFHISYTLDTDNHQIIRTATNNITGATKRTILANEVTALSFSRNTTTSALGLITIRIDAQRQLPDGTLIPPTPIRMSSQAEARNP